jgi:hypothetical protein
VPESVTYIQGVFPVPDESLSSKAFIGDGDDYLTNSGVELYTQLFPKSADNTYEWEE